MIQRPELANIRRIVIKVGTAQITRKGVIDEDRIEELCNIIAGLRRTYEVILVSSGAIAAGIAQAGLQVKKSLSIPYKQAAAAIGQTSIMKLYVRYLSKHNIPAGQILLGADVLQHKERYRNARNTIKTLLKIGALPIVNENDTVSIDEIKVGDNDKLAAMVSQVADADLLIILSDVDGFYRDFNDPEKRQLIDQLSSIDESVREQALPTQNNTATGGMITKLDAARMCLGSGIDMVLANGKDLSIIHRILAGEKTGTFFYAAETPESGHKVWLRHHLVCRGRISVDAGAKEALCERGTSLLPKGITSVDGNFDAGDGVSIVGPDNEVFACGICSFGRQELEAIVGMHSDEVKSTLGPDSATVAVHRDNLVLNEE